MDSPMPAWNRAFELIGSQDQSVAESVFCRRASTTQEPRPRPIWAGLVEGRAQSGVVVAKEGQWGPEDRGRVISNGAGLWGGGSDCD